MVLPVSYKRGEALRAADVNAILQELKSARIAISRLEAKVGGGALNKEPAIPIRVFNDTGAAVPIYGAMGINTQTYTGDTQRQLARCLTVEAIDPEEHYRNFVIANDEIAYQTTGWAWITGAFYCKINVTNENHIFCQPVFDETYLNSSIVGPARIIWADAGTGEKDAVISMNSTVARLWQASRDQSKDGKVDVQQLDAGLNKVGNPVEATVMLDSGYVIKDDWIRIHEAGGLIWAFKTWQYDVEVPEEDVEYNGWERQFPSTHHDGIEVPFLYDPSDTTKVGQMVFDYRGELVRIYGSGSPTPTFGPTSTQPPSATPGPTPTPEPTSSGTPVGNCTYCTPDPFFILITLTSWTFDMTGTGKTINLTGTYSRSFVTQVGNSCFYGSGVYTGYELDPLYEYEVMLELMSTGNIRVWVTIRLKATPSTKTVVVYQSLPNLPGCADYVDDTVIYGGGSTNYANLNVNAAFSADFRF